MSPYSFAVLAALAFPLPALSQEALSLPQVTVATVTSSPFRQEIALTGSLVPREEVQVSTAASGHAITELLADLGDTVEKGAVLARLDDRGLRAQLAQAEAELARATAGLRQAQNAVVSGQSTLKRAEQALARSQSLNASGAASRASLEEAEAAAAAAQAADAGNQDGVAVAEAGLATARAALQLAQKTLTDATIVAPTAGVISARAVQLGQVVVAGQEPLFRMLRDGEIDLSAQVLESDIALIVPGQAVTVALAGAKPLTGQVRLVSPTVDPVSRMGNLRIRLDDPDGVARAGMFASAKVLVTRRNGLAVPTTAVITKGATSAVLVLGPGDLLEERAVTPGLYTEGQTEIISGLSEGDQVVARASAFFATGDRVQAQAEVIE